MNFPAIPRITIHPAICEGQPTVRGLRYPVWQVLEWLGSGLTTDEIQTAHPALEPEDFLACLAFAAGRLKPLGHVALAEQDEKSEQWLLGRQGQWLAEQEFLKQLWERNSASNPA
jgi:uncharacterized protein (DUF433 family)